MKLKVDPDIAGLFGELEESLYAELKEDVESNGIHDPLIVSEDGIIVCGHQRYRIAKELGWEDDEIPIHIMNFENKLEMISYAIGNNRYRHNPNKYRWCLIGLRYLETEEREAKKRQGTRIDLMDKTLVNEFTKVRGRAVDHIAEKLKINPNYIYIVKKIENSPYEDLKEFGRKGERTIPQLHRELRDRQPSEPRPKLRKIRINGSAVYIPLQNEAGEYFVAFHVPPHCSRGVKVTFEPLEKDSLIAKAQERTDTEQMTAMMREYEEQTMAETDFTWSVKASLEKFNEELDSSPKKPIQDEPKEEFETIKMRLKRYGDMVSFKIPKGSQKKLDWVPACLKQLHIYGDVLILASFKNIQDFQSAFDGLMDVSWQPKLEDPDYRDWNAVESRQVIFVAIGSNSKQRLQKHREAYLNFFMNNNAEVIEK